ncbi:MAG: hypothetical protein WCH34_06645 [Bacteroidota bacterium]
MDFFNSIIIYFSADTNSVLVKDGENNTRTPLLKSPFFCFDFSLKINQIFKISNSPKTLDAVAIDASSYRFLSSADFKNAQANFISARANFENAHANFNITLSPDLYLLVRYV